MVYLIITIFFLQVIYLWSQKNIHTKTPYFKGVYLCSILTYFIIDRL